MHVLQADLSNNIVPKIDYIRREKAAPYVTKYQAENRLKTIVRSKIGMC